jgi:hypothetical protein
MIAHLPKLRILDGPHVTKKERQDAGQDSNDWEDDVDSDGEDDAQEESAAAGELVEVKTFEEISKVKSSALKCQKNVCSKVLKKGVVYSKSNFGSKGYDNDNVPLKILFQLSG